MKHYQTNVMIDKLKKAAKDAPFWGRLAKELARPNANQRSVNVAKLVKYSEEKRILVVPGKILGMGIVDKPIEVAAFSISDQAKAKIMQAKGKIHSIESLMKDNKKAKNVKIIG